MKRLITIILLIIISFSVIAQESENAESEIKSSKSILSINVGFAGDSPDSSGYGIFIKSASFINAGSFYYGFGSLFGEFVTLKEAFFESGILVGYNRVLGSTGMDIDLFLDFLVVGGRINTQTNLYQAEAPALHSGITLGFPALSDIDGAISLAPVIRPYNMQTGAWDFSRSYITLGFSLRFKSYSFIEQRPWSESVNFKDLQEEKL